ncbi:MAG: hypothetical protein QG670_329 [Thermoproteota archaeon]|nr:hypothetical protein [Thermoproteota archaeon]
MPFGDAITTVKHIQTWHNFKALASELHPDTIFYLVEPHPLRTPPIGLRLTFYHNQEMYVFQDYAEGTFLAKTGIPIANPINEATTEIREQDICDFLSNAFPWAKLVTLPPFMY